MNSNYAHTSEHSTTHPQAQLVQTPPSTRTLKFKDSKEANNWLHSVTMLPPVNPATDPTIDIIASERTTWVLHMIDAIYDTTSCFDNSKMLSHFQATSSSFIPELEIEAACHILFDILISYCRYGYQGLPKTNVHVTKSSSGKKHYAEDKTVDCLMRMNNVIAALRSWKSVCKGVVEEDTKKWQLINAPVGAVSKKESERRCNVTKKKAVVEGRKAKNELVVIKQGEQVASAQHQGLSIGDLHSSPGADAPRASAIASNRPRTPLHYDIVGTDGAGISAASYPEQAGTSYLQDPAPQSGSGSSAPHIPLNSAIYHEPPQVYTPTHARASDLSTTEGFAGDYQAHPSLVYGLQAPAPQANPGLSASHTPLDFAVAHHEPHVYGQAYAPQSYPRKPESSDTAYREPQVYGQANASPTLPDTLESFVTTYQEPQGPLYGIQHANHQHDWAPATFARPESNSYSQVTQHKALVKIEDQDEDFWHQFDYLNGILTNVSHHQPQFEEIDRKDRIPASVNQNQLHLGTVDQGQLQQPTPPDLLAEAAVQASALVEEFPRSPWELSAADADAELLSMAGTQGNFADVATGEVATPQNLSSPAQPVQVGSPQQGVKRGRALGDEGDDEHAALRRRMSDPA